MILPNQEIEIYSGEFELVDNTIGQNRIRVKGDVYFRWFPNKAVRFNARYIGVGLHFDPNSLGPADRFNLVIDSKIFSSVFITSILYPYPPEQTGPPDALIEGTCLGNIILGDSQVKVTEFRFVIPNVNPRGDVKLCTSEFFYYQQLELKGEQSYKITFNLRNSEKQRLLTQMGGYLVLASGLMISKKGMSLEQGKNSIKVLSSFLQFLEGRKISVFFLQGLVEDKVVWTDYSIGEASPFQTVNSWANENLFNLQPLWQSFSHYYKENKERQFVDRSLKWYALANCSMDDPENGIIIAQAALELIYNKFSESNDIISGAGHVSTAADKIELILDTISVQRTLPKNSCLKKFVTNNLGNAPKIITNIRNSLVHSKTSEGYLREQTKREKQEALQIFIHYIELSMLYYYKYEETYNNRTTESWDMKINGEIVPWVRLAK